MAKLFSSSRPQQQLLWRRPAAAVVFLVYFCHFFFFMYCTASSALSADYYKASCPHVEKYVQHAVEKARKQDPTVPAGLLRMHFHDCFTEVFNAHKLALLFLESIVLMMLII